MFFFFTGATESLDPSWMVFSVNTANTSTGSTTSTQFKPSFASTGTYDFIIDWGDGSESTITAYNDADLTHTYASAGIYTIKIKPSGTNPRPLIGGWYFVNTGDKLKMLNIRQWGTCRYAWFQQSFRGCENMTSTAPDVPEWGYLTTTDAQRAFQNCYNFTLANGNALNFSLVTNASSMFTNCYLLDTDFDQCDWNQITNMNSMFDGCYVFNGLMPTDMSACTDMRFMHRYNYLLNNITLANRNIAAVTQVQECFRQCFSLNQSFAGWDMVGVTNATNMFQNCHLNRENYDATLIAWGAMGVSSGVSINFGTSEYTAGGAAATARAALVTAGWTITDGGTYSMATGGAAVADMAASVDVFLCSGQSNMVGQGDSAEAPSVATTDAAQYIYTTGLVAGNDPCGVTVGNFTVATTGSLVPAFLNTYASESGRYPVAVHVASNGSSADEWDANASANLFIEACQYYEAALTALRDAGKTINTINLVWNLGETDADNITAGTYTAADVKVKLIQIINLYQSRFGANLKFFFIETGELCLDEVVTSGAGRGEMRAVQNELAAERANTYMATQIQKTFCVLGGMEDTQHYGQASLNLIGEAVGEYVANVV